MRGVRWDKVYGTNLDQVGPKKANLDQLGQVGRRFAVFCLLRKAPLTNLDQVGPVLFPTVLSDTKLLLTKNYSEIIIFEKLRISRVIP